MYHTEVDGTNHALGTSGFLYRSNKLMYDKKTQSLWSTLRGEPVVGPLVNQGIRLEQSPVVTTTWGEWKKRHPDTTVLSLNTGHRRNYGEGVAYKSYFSTDERMFETPHHNKVLKNKDEVLAFGFLPKTEQQVAIAAKYLKKNPIVQRTIGDKKVLILTDVSGANRVYHNPENVQLDKWDKKSVAVDKQGKQWTLTEGFLTASDGKQMKRLPAHRAFWFGWHSAFPDTQLIH